MLPLADDCDDCTPDYLRQSATPLTVLSTFPFVLTFLVVAAIAWQKLFPLLAGQDLSHEGNQQVGKRSSLSLRGISFNLRSWSILSFDRAAVLTFSINIALSAVLTELIFCEITNTLSRAARATALTVTIGSLLVLLILVTPALEVHSLVHGARCKFKGSGGQMFRLGWLFETCGLAGWLFSFWWGSMALIGPDKMDDTRHSFTEGCLERIAIIGIILMASLAGFAAVSSLWQTFGVKVRRVTETDISRKETGLNATIELIATKQSRQRALERKMTDAPPESFVTRVMGSIRGTADTHELAALRVEVAGLDTMRLSLSTSLRLLRARRDVQTASTTPLGRVCGSANYLFSVYCLYRIAATSLATARRWWSPSRTTFSNTDPINNVLALVAKTLDPTLDRAAWARQISFLLSGLMLLASFNAVLQTVLLFSRFTPARLLNSLHRNLALLVSQISATYVVSGALLLRSSLPKEMGGMIEGALGAGVLDTVRMERLFEIWFLGACGITTAGIYVGRKVAGTAAWEEDLSDEHELADLEGGKRS